jgi:hypothetical protein
MFGNCHYTASPVQARPPPLWTLAECGAQLAPKVDRTTFHSDGHVISRIFMLSFLLLSAAMGMKVVDTIATFFDGRDPSGRVA